MRAFIVGYARNCLCLLSEPKKNRQQLDKSHCPFREENETNSKMDTGMLETFKLG